jgi:hypothetical protein
MRWEGKGAEEKFNEGKGKKRMKRITKDDKR